MSFNGVTFADPLAVAHVVRQQHDGDWHLCQFEWSAATGARLTIDGKPVELEQVREGDDLVWRRKA